jgi:hypothetical protein
MGAEHFRSALKSDVHLFSDCKRVVDLYSKIAHGALDLRMPEQKLHSPQVACAPVDKRSFRSAE